ncbi:MAG: PAS domain S-box protein, partial [Thermoplasmata archaeon]
LLKNLLKQSDVGFIITDVDGKTIFWNRGSKEIFGLDEKEVLGKPFDFLGRKELIEAVFDEVDKKGRSVREVDLEDEPVGPEHIEMIAESVDDKEGESIGYSILVIDISERKMFEKEREKQFNILTTIMENTESQLVYFDRNFNFVYVNSAYAERTGYTKEELIGKDHFDLFPDEENERIFEKVRDTGEPVSFKDKPFDHPQDQDIDTTYWDWTLTPVKDREGEVQGLVLSLIETTDRVEYEQKIEVAYDRIEFLNSLNESIKAINRLFVRKNDIEEVLEEVPSVLIETKGFMNITFAMFDDEGVMSPMSNSGIHESRSWRLTREGDSDKAPGCVKEALNTKKEVLVEDIRPYCRSCPHMVELEEHQTAVIPIKGEETVRGVIRACYEPEVEIDEQSLELLRELSDDIIYMKKIG